MKRNTFGIMVGAGMPFLLVAAVMAFGLYPNFLTFGAALVAGVINGTVWFGFGRALYDVFIAREDR